MMLELFFTPMSALYRAAVRFRHLLYDRGVFKKKTAPLPVVSIGNVVAGGSGKTQVALLLAELLSQDLQVAILSRGYCSTAEHARKPLIVNPSKHHADTCGDEPLLLASRLRSTLIIVNKNRFKSALKAHEAGAQLLLLDDGMQHRRLHRDYEIVVIDGKSALSDFLPKGRLRDDLERLKIANLIFFVGDPEEEIQKKISTMTSAPHVVAKIIPTGFFHLNGEELGSFNGKKVAVFCGIGNPHRFVKTIEEAKCDVVATHFSTDHHILGEKSLRKFALLALQRGATALICSEKDKVKLLSNYYLPLPIVWMRVSLQIVENKTTWVETVNELKALVLGRGQQ